MNRPLQRNTPARGTDKYHLDKNECLVGARVMYERFCKNIKKEHICEYPEMSKAYDYMSELLDVPQENMLLTAGADNAIQHLLFALKNSMVFTPVVSMSQPTYQMAKVYAHMHGMVVRDCQYSVTPQNDECNPFNYTLNTHADILYIANPDNPTGACFDIQKYLDSDCEVIVDETYIEYADRKSVAHLVKQYKNLYVIRTLSKVYGAGAKVGCIISHPENIEWLNLARPAYEISNLGLAFLKSCVEEKKECGNIVKDTILYKSWLEDYFISVGINVIKTHANFVLIQQEDWLVKILDENTYYKSLKIANIDYIKLSVPDKLTTCDLIGEIDDRRNENNEKN